MEIFVKAIVSSLIEWASLLLPAVFAVFLVIMLIMILVIAINFAR